MPRQLEGYVVTGTFRRGGATVHLALEDRHGGREVLLLVEPLSALVRGGTLPDYGNPGLPTVIEGVLDSGTRSLVLAIPPGISLDRVMEGRLLDEDQALAITAQVASALDHLHRMPRPVVMGALSPRWVRVDEQGHACLNFLAVDPGAPAEGLPRDPVYTAPEWVDGEPGGPFCDVYSLGTLLGVMTGLDHPVRRRIQGGPTAGIVARATAANPAERFASVAELRAAVEQRQAEMAFRRADLRLAAPAGPGSASPPPTPALEGSGQAWVAVRRTTAQTCTDQDPALRMRLTSVEGPGRRGNKDAAGAGFVRRLSSRLDDVGRRDRRRRRNCKRRRGFLTDPRNLPLLLLVLVLSILALALLLTAPPVEESNPLQWSATIPTI